MRRPGPASHTRMGVVSTVRLRAGHVQPVWAGHPWIFAQAIAALDGAPGPGDVVSVVDPRGNFLGRGYYSPKSAIPVRILTTSPDEALDDAWLGGRVEDAFRSRKNDLGLPNGETTGYRLIHSEGDRLSGLVVDVFGDVASVQLLTAGMKRREDAIFGHIARVTGARSILEVASPHVQRIEGVESTTRIVRGPDVDALRFRERGFEYEIPIEIAQKTGFYFDQRENRARIEGLAAGRRVLDAFSYVGAFALAAARGGAETVLALDSSASALTTAALIARKNGQHSRIVHDRADLKKDLAFRAQRGENYDLVLLDPPKLIPTARHLEAGERAYRRLNTEGFKLVRRGGLLSTCSCSAAMNETRFLRMLAFAAREARRSIELLWLGREGPDHPSPPAFPEGRYLKCAVVRVH